MGLNEAERQEILGRIKISKIITIGGMSNDKLLAEIEAAGFSITDPARRMVGSSGFLIEPEPREVGVAVHYVAELGFRKEEPLCHVWTRIKDLGCDLCPPSAGLHLCLDWGSHPSGLQICVAMDYIAGVCGWPTIFMVDDDGGSRRLCGTNGDPDAYFGIWNRLAFVVPQKKVV